jgi:antitoxin component of MazEF toxin-antitoxin module
VEADAENWPELIALLAQKEAQNRHARIKWSEFAQAKSWIK